MYKKARCFRAFIFIQIFIFRTVCTGVWHYGSFMPAVLKPHGPHKKKTFNKVFKTKAFHGQK